MESKYVVITVDEYKELIAVKIRVDMEETYRDTIKKLEEEVDYLRSNRDFWYNEFLKLNTDAEKKEVV